MQGLQRAKHEILELVIFHGNKSKLVLTQQKRIKS